MAGEPTELEVVQEATSPIAGPKLEIFVRDPAAYARWCAENGTTPEAHLERFARLLRPGTDDVPRP